MSDYPDPNLDDLYAIDAEFIAALLQQQPQLSDDTKSFTDACQPNDAPDNNDVQLQLVQQQPLQEQLLHDMQQQQLYHQQEPQYYLPVQQHIHVNNNSFASLESLSSVDSYASATTATAAGQHSQLVQYGQPVYLQTPLLQQYVYHQTPSLQQSEYYPSPLLLHQPAHQQHLHQQQQFQQQPFQEQPFQEQPFQEQPFQEQQFHQQPFQEHHFHQQQFEEQQFHQQQIYQQQIYQQQEYQACVWQHSHLLPSASHEHQLQLCDPQQLVLPPSNEEMQAESSSSANNGPRVYVRKSCESCKASHVACDIERPCSRCLRLKKGDTCVDAVRKKRGRPAKNAPKNAPIDAPEGPTTVA